MQELVVGFVLFLVYSRIQLFVVIAGIFLKSILLLFGSLRFFEIRFGKITAADQNGNNGDEISKDFDGRYLLPKFCAASASANLIMNREVEAGGSSSAKISVLK